MSSQSAAASTGKPAAFLWMLLGGFVLFNLFVLAIVFLALMQSQKQYLERAGVVSQNLAQVLEQNISGTLGRIDLAMLDGADEFHRQAASGGFDSRELNAHLALQHSRLPEVHGIRIATAGGMVEFGTGLDASARINIADREFFVFLRDHPDADLFISKPVLGTIQQETGHCAGTPA